MGISRTQRDILATVADGRRLQNANGGPARRLRPAVRALLAKGLLVVVARKLKVTDSGLLLVSRIDRENAIGGE